MRMTKIGTLLGAVIGALAFACSSSSSGGGSGSGFPFSGPSCQNYAPTGTTQACTSCLQGCYGNSCITQDCSDYFNCYCPCAASDSSCQSGCSSKMTSACESCGQSVGSCIQGCASSCGTSGSSSGGGSGSGSGGGGNSTVSCYQTSGGAAGCSAVQVPASEQQTFDTDCTNQGGQTGTGCPTTNLVGCCKQAASEECYYSGTASMLQQACMQVSGSTWSTTP
jgi:hypothetical protein